MRIRGDRPRRPDSWSDAHARARSRAAERLDGPLDPTESAWLDEHLASCRACRHATAAYAAQRDELRALVNRPPVPPRDLWARTAAAIEREAGFRDRAAGRKRRRSLLAPYALLSAALVVAVVIGSLTSSRWFGGDGTTASSLPSGPTSAAASIGAAATNPGVTPMPIPHNTVEWVTQDDNGNYTIQTSNVEQVCPDAATPCPATAPTEQRPVDLNGNAKSVIGSPGGDQVVVVGNSGTSQTDNVSVLSINASPAPSESPSPSNAPSDSATTTASASPITTAASAPPTATPRTTPAPTPTTPPGSASPSAPPSDVPSPTVSPSVEVSSSPSAPGTVEIARDVIVVGQGASYSPSGEWFAFSARPADGKTGPDIYVWRVGEAEAHPVTTDHRSELGSWTGDVIVGSTAVETPNGVAGAVFLYDPATGKQTPMPQAGNVWRPSVDPLGRLAVYWTGDLRPAADGPGFTPDGGRLVVGAWPTQDATTKSDASPTAPADQAKDRNETTIVARHVSDWDARWDETGTRLAVWIADATDPSVGRLSLYSVDQFDGKIDLKKPLLDERVAKAGYAISKGKLVWAEPAQGNGSGDGRIFVFAWTDKGSGEVEGIPGKVIVIR